jgi:hypothetical protein
MSTIDHEYYVKREREERASADRSEDATARRIHLEMADRYSALQQGLDAAAPVAEA